ncbi:MAG: hypothetical protein RR361_02460, partial [Anaerovorax sp.]
NKKVNTITYLGVMLAFSVALLFLSSFVPGVELTLYALASFFVGIVIVEEGVKAGILFYVATILLSLVIVPNKMGILPYVFLFGLFGIAKFYIEKLRKFPLEMVLKLVFFNGVMAIGLFFFKELFMMNLDLPQLPLFLIIIGGEFMFLLYDYLYTQVIGFYIRNIKKFKGAL